MALAAKKTAEMINEESIAIFYFGGHGRGSGDKMVLAPVEGRSPNDGVGARLVQDNMRTAKEKLMILNCCRV